MSLARRLLPCPRAMRTRAPEGEGESGAWRLAERHDRWAFLLLAGFCVQIYAAPAEWIPAFVPLRLALSLSFGALALLILEHGGRRIPLHWDGVRGLALMAFLVWAAASHLWTLDRQVTDGWLVMVVKVALAWLLVVNLATTPRRLAILCLCLVAGSMVTSAGGILRYLSGDDLSQGFRTLWLGVYGDPNYLAEYLAMTVPMAVAFIARPGTRVSVRLLCVAALILGSLAFGDKGLVFSLAGAAPDSAVSPVSPRGAVPHSSAGDLLGAHRHPRGVPAGPVGARPRLRVARGVGGQPRPSAARGGRRRVS